MKKQTTKVQVTVQPEETTEQFGLEPVFIRNENGSTTARTEMGTTYTTRAHVKDWSFLD